MTGRYKLEHHRSSLQEIREIMNSMKTLSYMETRKLSRFLESQHAVVKNIENVASDFLSFHPETLPTNHETKAELSLYVMVGSERGFCGDFNHALLKQFNEHLLSQPRHDYALLAVGQKLFSLVENNDQLISLFNGASVVEEVPELIRRIVEELLKLQHQHELLSISCLFHNEERIEVTKVSPPFQDFASQQPRFSTAPVLNIPADDFILELTEHYLFAVLHEILYTSMMQENHHRVMHLEGAIRHLDDESAQLRQQCNMLRQEEIIEEIEVILLSAESITQGRKISRPLRPKHK